MTDEEKKKLNSPLANTMQSITDMTQKPASDVLDSMATKYMNDYNNAKFSYDMYNDPVYQIARDAYIKQGQQAAKNVQAQAAQYTGGYGNSYGAMAAQQQYNAALGQLNDIVPDLQDAAYGRFQDEQNRNLRMADWYKDLGDQAYDRGQTERANQLALAQIAADFGDLEGLKGFGIDTSKYEADLAEEKQKAADTAAWNKALQAAEMGDYEPLKKLGVDTSSKEKEAALDMGMYYWKTFQDDSILKSLGVPMDYLYAQAGLDANGNPITAATGYAGNSGYTGYTGSNPSPAAPVAGDVVDDGPTESRPARGYQTDTQEQMIDLYNKLLKYQRLDKGNTLTRERAQEWLKNFVHDDRLTLAQAQVVLEKLDADGYIKG